LLTQRFSWKYISISDPDTVLYTDLHIRYKWKTLRRLDRDMKYNTTEWKREDMVVQSNCKCALNEWIEISNRELFSLPLHETFEDHSLWWRNHYEDMDSLIFKYTNSFSYYWTKDKVWRKLDLISRKCRSPEIDSLEYMQLQRHNYEPCQLELCLLLDLIW
jgi:hypothetical protein